MTESPQQHEPNLEMASSTNLDYVLILDTVLEQNVPKLVVPEQPVPEQVINSQSPTPQLNLKPL